MSLGSYSLGSVSLGGEPQTFFYYNMSGAALISLLVGGTSQRIQNTTGDVAVAFLDTASGQVALNTVGHGDVSLSVAGTAQSAMNISGAVGASFTFTGSPILIFGGITYLDRAGSVAISVSVGPGLAQRITNTLGSESFLGFVTSDGVDFNVAKPNEFDIVFGFDSAGVRIHAIEYNCPRIAPAAKRNPRVMLEQPGCPAPTAPGTMLDLSGLIEDLTLSGAVLSGAVLSADVSIDDLLIDASSRSGTVLALSGLIEDLTVSGALSNRSGRPTPDFATPSKWSVLRGSIDLCGRGPNGETNAGAPDVRPGNGMYLDLCGTTPDGSGYVNARISTKQSFSFVAGNIYRISFYWCSYDPRLHGLSFTDGNSGVATVATSVPGNFVLAEDSWTQVSNATVPIIFDHDPSVPDTIGLLIDRVKLENLTTGVTMFYDDFDDENP